MWCHKPWGVAALNPRLMANIPTGMPRDVFISKGMSRVRSYIPKGLQPLAR